MLTPLDSIAPILTNREACDSAQHATAGSSQLEGCWASTYAEAWGRIRTAQQYGFYLEAVTLVENIISDRLISYLWSARAIGRRSMNRQRLSFAQLIRRWRECTGKPVMVGVHPDLQREVDQWREQRNRVIHALVQLGPDRNADEVIASALQARKIAFEGEQLARAVCDWCSDQQMVLLERVEVRHRRQAAVQTRKKRRDREKISMMSLTW